MTNRIDAGKGTMRHANTAKVFSVLLGLAWWFSAALAQAQPGPYPNRSIRVVVAYPPGGGADLTARLLAQKMGQALRQNLVIQNRPGANGSLGTDAVAKAAPDGYTILMVDRGALGINPSLYAKLPYRPLQDFAYIGIATEAPYVLVINPSLSAHNLAELAALAKAGPKSIQYGSFGIGSMAQFNLEALNQSLGIKLQHVPYKGAAAAVQAVVAGEVSVAIATAPSVLGFIRDGRLRALAVGSEQRLGLLPEVPTLGEAGGGADTLVPTYFGLAAPAGTPPAVVARLNLELKRALAAPEVAEKLLANGLIPAGGTPEAMASTVARDLLRFGALVKTMGIKAE